MAIGINWAEVWKPVWDPVWRQSAPEPPVIPPVVETGSTPGSAKGWRGVGYWPSEETRLKQELARKAESDDEDAILAAIMLWTIENG